MGTLKGSGRPIRSQGLASIVRQARTVEAPNNPDKHVTSSDS